MVTDSLTLVLYDENMEVYYKLSPGYNTVPVVVPFYRSDGLVEWMFLDEHLIFMYVVVPKMKGNVGPLRTFYSKQVLEEGCQLSTMNTKKKSSAMGFDSTFSFRKFLSSTSFKPYYHISSNKDGLVLSSLKLHSLYRKGVHLISVRCDMPVCGVHRLGDMLVLLTEIYVLDSCYLCIVVYPQTGTPMLFYWDLSKYPYLTDDLFLKEVESFCYSVNSILTSRGHRLMEVSIKMLMEDHKTCEMFVYVDLSPKSTDRWKNYHNAKI